MMIVKDTREKNDKVNFEDLVIGQVYENTCGFIGIKTHDSEFANCILYDAFKREWEVDSEGATTKVLPLQTTLLIER